MLIIENTAGFGVGYVVLVFILIIDFLFCAVLMERSSIPFPLDIAKMQKKTKWKLKKSRMRRKTCRY
jgi:hypothetical protein